MGQWNGGTVREWASEIVGQRESGTVSGTVGEWAVRELDSEWDGERVGQC